MSFIGKAEAKPDRPSNLCCYSQRVCHLEKLKGFDFCHKHILEDKASPFKPCDFVAKSNSRRCPNPAPKLPDRGKSFCIIHTRKAELRRAVEERRKRRHHEGDGNESYDENKEKRRRTSSTNSQKSDKADGHSSDEEVGAGSGDDYLKVDSAWHGDIDSDADSVDSEEEDPLKHAGVWTVEEATRICRDKMIKLRSLYIAQFKRLQHVLKERKRKYCQAIQAEEEEEAGECQLTPSQLIGRKHRHERPGSEALLHKQAKEKKHGTSTRHQNVSTLRCTYSPGGNRCPERVLPLTKHCMKHITHDPNQLLFQKCTFVSSGESPCDRNVAKVFKHTACKLHVELPANMKRPDVKKDLQDAKERARLRETRALEQKDVDVSEALQEKCSALVPPSTTSANQTEAEMSPNARETTFAKKPSLSSLPSVMSSSCPEKMDIDSSCSKSADDRPSSALSASVTAASSNLSSVSLSSISTPSESISPGFAAASLVAVCSSPQISLQGTPLDSVSNASRGDVESLPDTRCEQKKIVDASSDSARNDADLKPVAATMEDGLEDRKTAEDRNQEATISKLKEIKETGLSSIRAINTTTTKSEKAESQVKRAEQFVEESSETSSKGEGQESHILPQAFASHRTSIASVSPPPWKTTSSEDTANSGSQSVSNNPRVASPTSVNTEQDASCETERAVASKPSSKAPLEEPSANSLKVASKSVSQVSSKGDSDDSGSKASPSVTTRAATGEPSENTTKAVSKKAPQVTSKGDTGDLLGASSASKAVASTSTKTAAAESSDNVPKVASRSVSQVSSRPGDVHKASSQRLSPVPLNVVKQANQVRSGGPLHPSQLTTTASGTTVTQPSKTKPSVASDGPRPTVVKAFQHLPSGMTASSSKQFSAISSVVSKDTSKDLKTDQTKAQDQGDRKSVV